MCLFFETVEKCVRLRRFLSGWIKYVLSVCASENSIFDQYKLKSNTQEQQIKMQDWSVSSKAGLTPVFLNVYSFCHCCNVTCGWIGLGLYHTAIEIFGIEFMFHGWAGNSTGVSEVIPRTCPYRFEEQILLGNIDYGFAELDHEIVAPLKKQFISNTYDLLNNNCNHFALAMAQKLGLAQKHPQSYIFRLTNCGNALRCCIPNCILSGRLDWFRSQEKEKQQLREIRNSQIKYQQLVQEQEVEGIRPGRFLEPDQGLLGSRLRVRRQKIFQHPSKSP